MKKTNSIKDTIAACCGVKEADAYGLLHFMAKAGVIETEQEKKVKGKKGKPGTIFKFNADAVDKLHDLLSKVVVAVEKGVNHTSPAVKELHKTGAVVITANAGEPVQVRTGPDGEVSV